MIFYCVVQNFTITNPLKYFSPPSSGTYYAHAWLCMSTHGSKHVRAQNLTALLARLQMIITYLF